MRQALGFMHTQCQAKPLLPTAKHMDSGAGARITGCLAERQERIVSASSASLRVQQEPRKESRALRWGAWGQAFKETVAERLAKLQECMALPLPPREAAFWEKGQRASRGGLLPHLQEQAFTDMA